jgi:hypothetical protein
MLPRHDHVTDASPCINQPEYIPAQQFRIVSHLSGKCEREGSAPSLSSICRLWLRRRLRAC